jgi:hypothetical protein
LTSLGHLVLPRAPSNVGLTLGALNRLSFAMQTVILRIASMAKDILLRALSVSPTFEGDRGSTSCLALHLQGAVLSLIDGRKLKKTERVGN